MNPLSARMPLASWRPPALVRARERLAGRLGMGAIRLDGETPSGHQGLLMPERMYLVADASATLGGLDLGKPARLLESPTIGRVALPARGVLAIGRATWRIRDAAEYRLAREVAGATAPTR